MEYQIISDIHIETQYPIIPNFDIPKLTDNIILAGDIGHIEYWDQYVGYISRICNIYNQVILIAGNHEFYSPNEKMTINEILIKLDKLSKLFDNLIFLNDTYLDYSKIGYLLFGTVLWSYIPNNANINIPIYISKNKQITISEYNKLHFNSRCKLEQCIDLANDTNIKLIVVSHYSPSFNDTLHKKYIDDKNNYFYCSTLDKYLDYPIYNWVYGHTGFNSDKFINLNGCRFVSNQYNKNKLKNNDIIKI